MNRSQLISQLSQKHSDAHQKKLTSQSIHLFFDSIKKAINNGEKVEIRGFGVFTLKSYQTYMGRNPKTSESVWVRPKKLPTFKAGKDIRQRVYVVNRSTK